MTIEELRQLICAALEAKQQLYKELTNISDPSPVAREMINQSGGALSVLLAVLYAIDDNAAILKSYIAKKESKSQERFKL